MYIIVFSKHFSQSRSIYLFICAWWFENCVCQIFIDDRSQFVFLCSFFPFPTDFLSPHPPFPIIETIFEILSIFVLSHLSLSLRFVSFGSRLNAEPFYLLFNHKHLEWFCFHPSTRSFCLVFPQFYSMHKLCDEHHVRSFCPASLCVR